MQKMENTVSIAYLVSVCFLIYVIYSITFILVLDNTKYCIIIVEVMLVNTQFKKGVLELIVLLCVYKKDMYGYELVSEVSKVINVNEGTIYPLLKRLTNEHYFETYLSESTEGPPRKYYRITGNGKTRTTELLQEWNEFHEQVSRFIKESEIDDER